ncbi:hypothetical protein SCHPADRAFT_688930 [Schizopora paradoxa]|uniref:Uncharacterized protein n=1 Tax=Schizopora paradoxa TaxID=27342 RepID=A0A0H2RNV6_9AGAM|nr:hypothetical protein SCHPADRAFT_688930 [Schizopora paradoxa]
MTTHWTAMNTKYVSRTPDVHCDTTSRSLRHVLFFRSDIGDVVDDVLSRAKIDKDAFLKSSLSKELFVRHHPGPEAALRRLVFLACQSPYNIQKPAHLLLTRTYGGSTFPHSFSNVAQTWRRGERAMRHVISSGDGSKGRAVIVLGSGKIQFECVMRSCASQPHSPPIFHPPHRRSLSPVSDFILSPSSSLFPKSFRAHARTHITSPPTNPIPNPDRILLTQLHQRKSHHQLERYSASDGCPISGGDEVVQLQFARCSLELKLTTRTA